METESRCGGSPFEALTATAALIIDTNQDGRFSELTDRGIARLGAEGEVRIEWDGRNQDIFAPGDYEVEAHAIHRRPTSCRMCKRMRLALR